jgi:hypothetical protein
MCWSRVESWPHEGVTTVRDAGAERLIWLSMTSTTPNDGAV